MGEALHKLESYNVLDSSVFYSTKVVSLLITSLCCDCMLSMLAMEITGDFRESSPQKPPHEWAMRRDNLPQIQASGE